MSKLRQFFRASFGIQGRYQRKLLGSFLLVSVVLFFIFSLLVLFAADRRYRAEIDAIGKQTITQARNTSDTLLMDVFSYGLQSITHDTELARWMYKEKLDVSDAIAANNILNDFRKSNSYADNYYIFNFSSKSILTKAGEIPFSEFYDQELLELVTDFKPSVTPKRYTPRLAVVRDTQGRLSAQKVWTLIFRQSYGGALVLDVSYDDYTELLNIRTESTYINSWIINEDGLVLAGADDEQFGADMADDPLLRAVLARNEKEGSFQFEDPETGRPSTVHYIQNAYLGFIYISKVQNSVLGLRDDLFLTILGLSTLFFLLSAAGSIILTGLVYRPVRALTDVLNLGAPPQDINEFELFREAYETIRQKNKALLSTAEAWRNAEEQKMLRKWIEPDAVTTRYRAEQYEAIEDHFRNPYFNCVLFSIDLAEDGNTPEDLGLLKYAIKNMIEELAEGFFLLRCVDHSASQLVCICNFEDKRRTRIQLHQALTSIQDVLEQQFHITVTIIVGVTVDDTGDLPQSQQSAKQVLNRRFVYGPGALIFCEDTASVSAETSSYPQEQETQLLSAARAGDPDEACRQLSAFFERIRPYQMDYILLYLLQLDLAIQKLEGANHLDTQPLDLTKIYTASMTLDQLRRQFEVRIAALADLVKALRESSTDKLVTRVNDLVQENLCDQNLTVAWLADEVDLSVNYLRNVYKESTGENLSAYINRAKLSLICELLQTSDLSIQEISKKLGFSTSNYFFTYFKKHMGVTPKQYRSSHGSGGRRKDEQ